MLFQAFSLLFLLIVPPADPSHEIRFPFLLSENQPTSSQVYGNTTGVVEEHVTEQHANGNNDPLSEDLVTSHQGNPNINNFLPARVDNDINAVGLRILVSAYNKYPIDRRIYNTKVIDADLSRLSGMSMRDTRLCRSALQLGIYDFLGGPEPKKRKANFASQEEKTTLKNLVKQEKRGFEDWDRIARVLRLTNPSDCASAWEKLRDEFEIEEMLDFNVDEPPFYPLGGGDDGDEPPAGGAGVLV